MPKTPQVPPAQTRAAVRFSDPRKQRIYKRLMLIGQGPADFYWDFCAVLEEPWLRSTSHVAAHLLREIESAVRAVLLPADYKAPKGERGHLAEINAILASTGLETEGALADSWRRLAGDDPLHRRAHRDNLAQP